MLRRSRSRRFGRASRAGFTLVELMAVVTVIGILSALAMVSFRKYLGRSKNIEAVAVMRAISAAQERYRGEHMSYLNVSNGDLTRYYPRAATAVDNQKVHWVRAAGNDAARWARLAVNVPHPVHFGYSTVAGLPGTAFPTTGLSTQPAWPSVVTSPWYVVQAVGDPDGVGRTSLLVLSSFSNQIAEQ